MRILLITTRRWMLTVAGVAMLLGGMIGACELDRRSDQFRRRAEYHRQMEQELGDKAARFERLASDPAEANELPLALFRANRWSRGQALEMELERHHGFLPSPRWSELAREARAIAANHASDCRKEADYHAREKRRFYRAAFSPWLPTDPDPFEP
jgi:hypothetical protein